MDNGSLRPTVAHCPVCTGNHFSYQFNQGGSPIVRCDGCGLLLRNPQPSDVELDAARRTIAAMRSGSDNDLSGARNVQVTAADLLDRIERYLGWDAAARRGKRVVDVGCGVGDLLAEAAARGYAVVGIASASSVHRTAGDGPHASLIHGSLEAAALQPGSCDLCVVGDALEESRTPQHLLARAHELLRPGGAIFVATPSLDSWPARLRRNRWAGFRADRLSYFSAATLESVLVRAGFEHIRLRRPPLWRLLDGLIPGRRRVRGLPGGVEAIAVKAARLPIDHRRAKVSVVMPVFNEKRTFSEVFSQLIAKDIPDLDVEIVIVESRSTDGTRDDVAAIAGHPRVVVVWEDRPRGKGHAVRAGLARASGDFVLIQDADLEYDLGDYEMLLEPLRTFRRAFVLGARHGRDGHTWKVRHFTDQVFLGQWMNVGHLIFTAMFNLVYGQRLRDPFTMFKVFRRECLSGVEFECNRFDFDFELVGKLVRCGYEPLELGVNYESRSFSEGKKVTLVRDPLTWVRACIRHRFTRLKDDRPSSRVTAT